jgi:hypothetical protein
MRLDLCFPVILSSQKKAITVGLLRYVVMGSYKLGGEMEIYVRGEVKSRNTRDMLAATPQDPTDSASLMRFCVAGMLVHVTKTIHGDFGAMDPVRLNCRHKSYLGGHWVRDVPTTSPLTRPCFPPSRFHHTHTHTHTHSLPLSA